MTRVAAFQEHRDRTILAILEIAETIGAPMPEGEPLMLRRGMIARDIT